MNVRIEEGWKQALASEWEAPYFEQLTGFVSERYRQATIYPPGNRIFAAFDACPFDKVKVVILGQDPYHGPGQANGLCFSVNPGIAMPPSLINIFKEIHDDTGSPMPADGDLSRWAAQGVLLLNATLTVEAHQAGSHQGKGWETFTDHAIEALSRNRENLVFILWGSYATTSRSPTTTLPATGSSLLYGNNTTVTTTLHAFAVKHYMSELKNALCVAL